MYMHCTCIYIIFQWNCGRLYLGKLVQFISGYYSALASVGLLISGYYSALASVGLLISGYYSALASIAICTEFSLVHDTVAKSICHWKWGSFNKIYGYWGRFNKIYFYWGIFNKIYV